MQSSSQELRNLPTDKDILCGRTSTSKHPGNIRFRRLVLARVDDYMHSTKKATKSMITATILDEAHKNGARFMKFDRKTNTWGLITSAEARDKVSHAIRDQVRIYKAGTKSTRSTPPQSLSVPTTILNNTTSAHYGPERHAKGTSMRLPKQSTPSVSEMNGSDGNDGASTRCDVAHGPDNIVTLVTALQKCRCIVSEEEGHLCSTDDKANISIVPCLKGEVGFACERYVDSNDRYSPAPILSYDWNQRVLDYILLANNCAQEPSLIFNVCGDSDSGVDDDASTYLDHYNELTVGDIAHHFPDDEPSYIVSMLQEVCSVILYDS
jgi:hypothetical protein